MNYELGIMRIWNKLFLVVFLFIIHYSLFIIPAFAQDNRPPFEPGNFQPFLDYPDNNPSYGSNNNSPFFGSNNSIPRYGSNNTGRGGIRIDNPLAGIADDIPGLIGYVLNAVKGIAGLIAVLMIVVGAYQILFSAGDPAGFKKGRQTIVYALIGLAVVLLANVLVSIIREIVGSV